MKKTVKNILIGCTLVVTISLVAAKHIVRNKGITFELFNTGIRKNQTLFVSISGLGIFEVGPQQKLQEKIDPKKNISIRFYQTKPFQIRRLVGGVPKLGEYKLRAPGKDKYLMFVWDKGLEVQVGPMMGLLGVTFSGLSTKNNIAKNQIKVVKRFNFERVKN